MKFYKVTWRELEEDCFALYKKVKKYHFDCIMCISRGGLVWSRMLSDLLELPISHLTAFSYTGIHKRQNITITKNSEHKELKNQTLLVIDEIADHGKTLNEISKYLNNLGVKKLYTMAPIVRTFTKPLPDFYLKVIDEWIMYPYDMKENYRNFLKIYKTSKKSREMLLKNGFESWEIENL